MNFAQDITLPERIMVNVTPEMLRSLTSAWQAAGQVNALAQYGLSYYSRQRLSVDGRRERIAHLVACADQRVGREEIEELAGQPTDRVERQSIFWVNRSRYAALDAELRSLYGYPQPAPFSGLRLHDLPDGELRHLLVFDLQRAAALDERSRRMLCMPPRGPR